MSLDKQQVNICHFLPSPSALKLTSEMHVTWPPPAHLPIYGCVLVQLEEGIG